MQFIGAGHLVLSRYPIKRHHWQYFSSQTIIESFVCSRGSIYAELVLEDGSPLHVSACHTTSGTDVVIEAIHLEHTRLHSGGNPKALLQVQEWVQQVDEQVARSVTSSNSSKSLPAATTKRSKPTLVMCGDLNITPQMREYSGVCEALGGINTSDSLSTGSESQLRDAFDGVWKPTFGMSEQNERLLTQAADRNAQKTVDYIFATVAPEHVTVDALRAPEAVSENYQQVSDHCAVVARWSW